MTAAHIASSLGARTITLNYETMEIPIKKFTKNPTNNLEYAYHGFNFKRMIRENAELKEQFPFDINFREPKYKTEYHEGLKFTQLPETEKQLKQKTTFLVERMNQMLQVKSEKGTRNICYLIISHGANVDNLANIFFYL